MTTVAETTWPCSISSAIFRSVAGRLSAGSGADWVAANKWMIWALMVVVLACLLVTP
jgi:hypothetical protein